MIDATTSTDILIIGNGFDIEHDLPTRYPNFIDYIQDLEHSKAYELSPENSKKYHATIKGAIGKNNWFFKIIVNHYNDNKARDKWVDFEWEIAQIVKWYEHYYYAFIEKASIKVINEASVERSVAEVMASESVSPDTLKEDFYRFRYAFELYISLIVNNIHCAYRNKGLLDINPSLVISFNYSNTYERLYGSNAEVCYIHGKAQLTEEDAFNNFKKDADYYSSKNHIVFGMDEYLAEDERKAKNEFFCFRKYFQRTNFNTDTTYMYLLERKYRAIFFGYSLNAADASILKSIIGNERARVVVFYYNQKSREDEVKNLYSIFDLNIEKRMNKQSQNAITFVEQSHEHVQ